MLSEVLKNQPIKDKCSLGSLHRSFFSLSFLLPLLRTNPLLDSTEIIDRVHYARAKHRYLHTPTLQRRRVRGVLSLPRVLESLMHSPRMQFPLHVSPFRVERCLRLKCDKPVFTEINKARQ